MGRAWGERRKNRLIYRGKCPWRGRQIARAAREAGSRGQGLLHCLVVVLALEAAAGIWQVGAGGMLGFRFVEMEKEYRMEWIAPAEADRESFDEAYGIRLRPDVWELQFYHRTEEIREKQ